MELVSSEYLESFTLGCTLNWQEVDALIARHVSVSNDLLNEQLLTSAHYSALTTASELNPTKSDPAPKTTLSEKEKHFYQAYRYATENPLNKDTFLRSFELLSSSLLPEKLQGRYREANQKTYEGFDTSIPLYVSVESENVEKTFSQLIEDINSLLTQDLSTLEVFYYASVIHLWLLKIHPFPSANGAAARLLEKWFLASKLGRCAWCIESEKHYFENVESYKENISLGFNFYALFWERCIPFLLMLPDAFENSNE